MVHTRNQLRERVDHHLERFENGTFFDNDEQYLPFFYEERVTVADWAGEALFVVDEPIRFKEALAGYEADIRETYATLLEAAMVLPSQADLYMDAAEVAESVGRRQTVAMSLLARAADGSGDRLDGILPAASDNIVAQTKQAEILRDASTILVHEIKNYRKGSTE